MTANAPDARPGPGSGFAAPWGGPAVGGTVLGTGVGTARRAVDDGLIGVPVAASAFITAPGPERPYPASALYDRPGGGPLFDTGPHHISALVHLLGPVGRVTATAPRPRARERFEAEVDTQVTGLLEHTGGALTTLVMNSGAHQGGSRVSRCTAPRARSPCPIPAAPTGRWNCTGPAARGSRSWCRAARTTAGAPGGRRANSPAMCSTSC